MNTHREVSELLPWFVNGTLDEREQALVGKHIDECSICRNEVSELVATAALFTSGSRPEGGETLAARDRFMYELDRAGENVPRRGRWYVPASLAAGLLFAALLFAPLVERQNMYRALSSDPIAEGPVLQVIFAADATEETIRSLLIGGSAHIVAGPTSKGVYRVELGQGADVSSAIATLSRSPAVRFVELEASP